MKTIISVILVLFFLIPSPANSGLFDDFMEKVNPLLNEDSTDKVLSLEKTISGLKEALSVGTGNAVSMLSMSDGYFGNELTKILMPEKIQKVADMLKKVGFGSQVDSFVLTMNRAAENVYRTLLEDGDQNAVLDDMQTRMELYDYLDYHAYEQKLDELFARERGTGNGEQIGDRR